MLFSNRRLAHTHKKKKSIKKSGDARFSPLRRLSRVEHVGRITPGTRRTDVVSYTGSEIHARESDGVSPPPPPEISRDARFFLTFAYMCCVCVVQGRGRLAATHGRGLPPSARPRHANAHTCGTADETSLLTCFALMPRRSWPSAGTRTPLRRRFPVAVQCARRRRVTLCPD